jgi:dTDP-glucose 4,6-dehydratase
MIIHAISGKPLPVYGDGLNVRDWLHVEDHCRAIALILEHGKPGETYNVGGNSERNNRQVLARLCARIDASFRAQPELAKQFPAAPAAHGKPTDSAIQFVKDRAGHDRRYAIDATRIRRELGFEPRWDFDHGIDATVDWYLARQYWWSPILQRL